MRVLLLADVNNGWIVERCADRMVAGMPDVEFSRGYYCCLSSDEIVERAAGVDLIHGLNWNFAGHLPRVLAAAKPVLVSVRSHRYPPVDAGALKRSGVHVHAVSRALEALFPGSSYIPDGLMIDPEPLIVGFAGKPGPYKGTDLIEQACRRIGARLQIATDLDCCEMYTWFRDIDVLACASENEGFGTVVVEALALNKPVLSTRCGAAWEARLAGVTWVDRTVDAIAAGLRSHWTAGQLDRFSWSRVCEQFGELYRRLV